jgi:peptidoglycan/LPS O-acetylase OafA/YrhL
MINPEQVAWHQRHVHNTLYLAYENAVDTFLVMGSLLMTISTLNAMHKKKLNLPRMIWCRFLRYTPPLAALLLFTVTLYKFFLDGPWIEHNVEIIRRCKKFWYSTIFHFQNYLNPEELCLSHTWYLTMDFQLYIISPFLIYPALRYGWKYLFLVPGLAVFSSVYILLISLIHKVELTTSGGWRSVLYYSTHLRFGPWMIGIALGYVFYTYKDRTLKIGKGLNAFLWIASLSLLAFSALSYFPFNVPGQELSITLNALQFAFSRILWTIGLCWIIFACQKLQTGGIVRWFLSLPQWQPIGRMGLSIYIIHCFYQKTIIFNQKRTFRFDLWEMVRKFSFKMLHNSFN